MKRGVVGAELAELVLDRRIGMENDRIVLADPGSRSSEPVSAFVLDAIRGQSEAHPVPVWVAAVADQIFDLVTTRLIDEDIVHRVGGSRLLLRRSAYRFPATDLLAAAGPRLRLEHLLRAPRELDPASSVCAAVLGAVGAARVLNADGDRAATRQTIATITEAFPVDLRSLVTGLEVAHAAGELPPSLRLRTSDK